MPWGPAKRAICQCDTLTRFRSASLVAGTPGQADLQRRVDRMMDLADINHDGKLDFSEFVYTIKTLEVRIPRPSTSTARLL